MRNRPPQHQTSIPGAAVEELVVGEREVRVVRRVAQVATCSRDRHFGDTVSKTRMLEAVKNLKPKQTHGP